MVRCTIYLLKTTQRKYLLSLLQIMSNISQKTESLFLAPKGYSLYLSILQSMLTLVKHCSDTSSIVSYLNIILSFPFPPYFTDDWLSTLVNASLIAVQVSPVQTKGVRTLSRLLIVESERVLTILDEPNHRITLLKAINDFMACASNSELHLATFKLIGALGGWIRDHLDPIVCSPTIVPKADPLSCCSFEIGGDMKLSLSHEQLIMECSRVLSTFSKHPSSLSLMLATAKHKAFDVLQSLFPVLFERTGAEELHPSDSTNLNAGERDITTEKIRTAYLYALFVAACNPVLHSEVIAQLRKCAIHCRKLILQNSKYVPVFQTQWSDVANLLGPFFSDFNHTVNPNFEFIFNAFIRFLRQNCDFLLSVAYEWIQLLYEQLQNVPPDVFHSFFDSFVIALVSIGLEEGWKSQIRVCSVFNFMLYLFDNQWGYRVTPMFLRFYLRVLNVLFGLNCNL